MPKEFYNSSEIAERLGLTAYQVNQLMHQFEANHAAVRIGRQYRIRMSVFDRWLNEQDGGPATK